MPASFRLTTVLALFLTASLAHAAGPTGLLNDTGQTSCYDGANIAVACDSSGVGSDADANPRQDARFGRDAAQAAGVLPAKTGGGAAGFDFTKVCMSGELAGQGSCPANPLQGINPNEWACTKDNVTNLIWSVEFSNDDTWYGATNTAPGSLIDGYHTANRCGFSSGWRAPTRRELFSIVHRGVNYPSIDTNYFPGTDPGRYWSSDDYAGGSAHAWYVDFVDGMPGDAPKNSLGGMFPHHARLVHNGP